MSNLAQYARKADVPGRGVPVAVAIRIAGGGILTLIGWAVFGFTMIFWWVFGMNADVASHFQFDDSTRSTTGRIIEVRSTGYTEGGSKNTPGTPIYQYEFEYDLGSGSMRRGTSFTLGQVYQAGQSVPVEFVPADPAVSRIQGARRAAFGAEVMLVALFPLIGIGLIIAGYVSGVRTLAILRRGKIAQGRLIDKQPTNTSINKQRVFALTFEFVDESGHTHRATVRTHHTHKAEDDPHERLFYDPQNPARAYLVDLLPKGVHAGFDGSLTGTGPPVMVVLAICLPAVVLVVHGMVALAFYA
ncbi:MAG: DUF3592 domain-containing protein [Planctomycetes bacterium]|nr:DUF3592 domain-containing protein [Planctomycetota bacterium]